MAVIVIVFLIVVGAAGYYAGMSGSPGGATTTTVTVGGSTTTVTAGAGATGTVTTTATVTASGGGGGSKPGLNQSLVDLAKAEGGSLTIYGSVDATQFPTINALLLQAFPWMKVNYVGLSASDVRTRAITEFQAGHVQAEVLMLSHGGIALTIGAGAVQPFHNYMKSLMNASAIDPANAYHVTFINSIVLEYNTNLVKDTSTLPKSWQDLTQPQWKGKFGIDPPSSMASSGTLFAALEPSMGNASWTQFLKAVAANNPVITNGQTYNTVATGNTQIEIGLLNDVITGKGPVAVRWMSAAYFSISDAVLTKGASHPFTGELYIQWLTSYYGQVGIAKTGRLPLFQPVLQQYFGQYIPSNVTLTPAALNFPGFFQNASKWAAFYTNVFGA